MPILVETGREDIVSDFLRTVSCWRNRVNLHFACPKPVDAFLSRILKPYMVISFVQAHVVTNEKAVVLQLLDLFIDGVTYICYENKDWSFSAKIGVAFSFHAMGQILSLQQKHSQPNTKNAPKRASHAGNYEIALFRDRQHCESFLPLSGMV